MGPRMEHRVWRATFGLMMGLAALIVLGCGPTLQDAPAENGAEDGGVIAPAVERPNDLDDYLELPDDVEEVAFAWSEVVVQRAVGDLTVGVLVANTPERRTRGMMYRSGLPPGAG